MEEEVKGIGRLRLYNAMYEYGKLITKDFGVIKFGRNSLLRDIEPSKSDIVHFTATKIKNGSLQNIKFIKYEEISSSLPELCFGYIVAYDKIDNYGIVRIDNFGDILFHKSELDKNFGVINFGECIYCDKSKNGFWNKIKKISSNPNIVLDYYDCLSQEMQGKLKNYVEQYYSLENTLDKIFKLINENNKTNFIVNIDKCHKKPSSAK